MLDPAEKTMRTHGIEVVTGRLYEGPQPHPRRLVLSVEGDKVTYCVPGVLMFAPLVATRSEFEAWAVGVKQPETAEPNAA